MRSDPCPSWTSEPWTSEPWASVAVMAAMRPRLLDQVDDGEDQDPHHVDEVPVEADDLDRLGPGMRYPTSDGHGNGYQQHQDADGHVDTVEARQGEERRTGDVGGEAEAFTMECREL